MRACLREAGSERCDRIWLSVWELNPRALAFYRKWGFEQVGARPFRLGRDVSTDLIMQRAVESQGKWAEKARRDYRPTIGSNARLPGPVKKRARACTSRANSNSQPPFGSMNAALAIPRFT